MPQFAATTHAFEKGVDKITPDAAVKLIESWEDQLADIDSREGKAIVKDLGSLKKELQKGDKLDGAKVKELTAKLGQETVASAKGIEGAGQEKVRSLGEALTKAAR